MAARMNEANILVSDLGVRQHALEEELAQAIDGGDAQRAVAEQKAREVEVQAAELRRNAVALEQKDKALEAKETKLQREKAAITTLTDTLVGKDVVLEAREVAVRDAETALKEREASLSVLQQQADAARALLEQEKERTEGKCPEIRLSCF